MTQPPTEEPREEEYHGTGSAAEGGTIYHAEIDPKFQELALENLWAALKGNGVKRESIHVTKFEGETLEFIAINHIQLKTKISDKRQAGKVTTMPVIGSEEKLHEAIKKETHKITHSQDVIKRIKDVILQRKDKGFGIKNEPIKLSFLHKNWVIHEPCHQCSSKGKINCPKCHGKGTMLCPRCHGNGSETCHNCGGRQYLHGPNNQKQQCMHCNGTGKTGCRTCHQGRTVSCSQCKGSTIITCTQCNGHGWNSRIFMVEIDGIANFEYDAKLLPDKIVEQIENLGSDLPEHIEFKPVIMDREHEQDTIILPYQLRVPHADISFEISEKMNIDAFMFGQNALLLNTPNFLEKLMNRGIKQLKNAGKDKGDISAQLILAGRYKTLRQIILASSKLSNSKALTAIMQRTPIGLSKDKAENLIIAADNAMRLITKRPRQLGLLLGSVLSGALYSGYFYALRAIVLKAMPPNLVIHNLIDALICLCGITLSIFTIKAIAGHAIQKTLSSLTKGTNKKLQLAKAGKQANRAILLSFIIFLTLAFLTLTTNAPPPHWVLLFQ